MGEKNERLQGDLSNVYCSESKTPHCNRDAHVVKLDSAREAHAPPPNQSVN